MDHAPHPKTHLAPLRIADDTFVIQDHHGEGTPQVVHLNSMLIRGEQPVVVDTGGATNRDRYLADLFGLVEPEDVRWVFLSHDDPDHHGNLAAVMDACPNATLLTSWFAMDRLACEALPVPPTRWRWLAVGEALDIGDREIVPLAAPLYDSPATQALFDTRTRAYWAADGFSAPVPAPTYDAAELPLDEWVAGFHLFQQWNSPWVTEIDRARWQRTVDAFAALAVGVVATGHGPVVRDDRIAAGIDILRQLPDLPFAPQPGQAVLDQIVAGMTAEAAPAPA